MSNQLSIGFVASQVGVSTATLRKWEERYGYPKVERNVNGERYFSFEQLKLLKHARRLIQNGMKPSRLFASDGAQLIQNLAHPELSVSAVVSRYPDYIENLLSLTKQQNLIACRALLRQIVEDFPLIDAVEEIFAPWLHQVGEAWACNDIEVYQEHALSILLQEILSTIPVNHSDGPSPRILLATPAGERHGLGLMMVQSVLRSCGADCISLGCDIPSEQIVQAIRAYKADILALSVSQHSKPRIIQHYLHNLEHLLPEETSIWAGGAGIRYLKKYSRNINYFLTIREGIHALEQWCSNQLTEK